MPPWMPAWLVIVLGIVVVLAATAVWDVVQTQHSVLRVYPILGRLRYLIEKIGPEIRQYFVICDLEELPYSRV